MKYTIEIQYETGNSLETYVEVSTIEDDLYWDNIENAKEALLSIKEHYELYNKYIKYWRYEEEKVTKESILSQCKEKKWFVNKEDTYFSEWYHSIKFILDNGNEYIINPFWIGYFERLISIEIIIIDNQLTKYEFK